MSEARTKGRLHFRANGDANSYFLMDDHGRWVASLLLNGEQVIERQVANMEHIVSCWNDREDGASPKPEGALQACKARLLFLAFGQAHRLCEQGLTWVSNDLGTKDQMLKKYHNIDCTLVPSACIGDQVENGWAIFRSVTMSQAHAMHVARFVNDHDDGTAQPRARAVPRGTHWLVEIKSTEVTDGGDLNVVTDLACSLSEAKDVLGY